MGDEWSLCARPDWHRSLLFFSLSLSVVRLDKVISCVWFSQMFDFMRFCDRHAIKHVSTLYSMKVLLRYEETTEAHCRVIKHQSKNMIYSACSLTNTFSPSPTLIHTQTSMLSLWASPQVLGYCVKQLEWAQKSQRAVCALDSNFTLKFPRLTETGATKPDSCEGFRPLCQDYDFWSVCVCVWGGERQGYALSCGRTL